MARQVGKGQSTIANKLRLLRLPTAVKEGLKQGLITERHARELLRLEGDEQQIGVFEQVRDRGLTVRETEILVSRVLGEERVACADNTKPVRMGIYKDLRIFLNSFRQVVKALRQAGVNASIEEVVEDDWIRLTVRIPKEGKADKGVKRRARK